MAKRDKRFIVIRISLKYKDKNRNFLFSAVKLYDLKITIDVKEYD